LRKTEAVCADLFSPIQHLHVEAVGRHRTASAHILERQRAGWWLLLSGHASIKTRGTM